MNLGRAKFLLVLFLCGFVTAGATTAPAASSPLVSKRCAFDIGSGETKVSAAEVTFVGSTPGIVKLMAKKAPVPFIRNLKDSVIPEPLIKQAITKINEFKRECETLGAEEYFGVATSGFRMARNAQQALAKISQEIDVPLQVITGEQEAVLAFVAVASALRSNGNNLVVWDIGGGSLQFSMSVDGASAAHREYVLSSGHQGAELFRREIAKRLNHSFAQGVSPLGQQEMTRAIELARQLSRAVNPKIMEQLRRGNTRVVGLGGVHTESLAAQAGLQGDTAYNKLYTLDGVRAAAKRAADMSEQDFRKAYPENKYPENQATNIALVLGYMEGLQIKEVIPLEVTLADGLLADPTYWPQKKQQ